MPPTAADPVPVRALNQVTYCPRLYYLQYVDCVMVNNEHVEAGLHDHRRVDDPGLAGRPRKEGDATRTRGAAVSSDALGITAVLDLVEEKDGDPYPVETKHGSAPRDADGRPTTWDNDAVQLCAQGMLLEEQTGRPVARGFQFYAGSRERVAVPFTPELRAQTRQAIDLCRDLSARDAPPDPLPADLRHRCFGCSLAPVCLPEETLYQIGTPAGPAPAEPPAAVTRVIPQSDDGAVLYLQEPGSHVGKRSEHLVVRKDGAELAKVPVHAVRQVCVFGNVQVSTQALETLAANDVPVAYLTGHGRFLGAFVPAMPKNVGLREAQFRRFADPAECLRLAKAVVRAKLTNQRALLMRSLRSAATRDTPDPTPAPAPDAPPTTPDEPSGGREFLSGGREFLSGGRQPPEPPSPEPPATAPDHSPTPPPPPAPQTATRKPAEDSTRGSDEPAARGLADLLRKLDDASSVDTVLGLEGQGAALYFGEFGRFLKARPPGRGFDFTARTRRPPRDPVNALLSFAYAMLAKDCFAAVCAVGFDPYKGFFHQNRHGKPSLALDLMEEFRSVVADSVVLTLVNNEMLTPADFLTWRDACQLTEGGRKTFFAAYEQRKATVVTHPVYGYKMSYSRMLEVQARMLAAYVRGSVPGYTGFVVR